MSEPAISIHNLSKSYKLGTIGRHTLADEMQYLWHKIRGRDPRHHMMKIGHAAAEVKTDKGGDGLFWALRDVSFDVQPGEVIGIVGRNGAGKSTLLKLLTRITEPSSGEAVINGRVASLLEVGTGFHPELTGRENVFMNGTILGMKRAEIESKFDEIVAFSEIEKFIDTPVKRYSSGMYVRLAFSIAAHLEPEILLVDEVLAVGDAGFQKKCLGKMSDVASEGRTILFVSHNMAAVQNLCTQCVVLKDGGLEIGPVDTEKAIDVYLSQSQQGAETLLRNRMDRQGAGRIRMVDLQFCDMNGNVCSYVASGRPVLMRVFYQVIDEQMSSSVEFAIGIYNRTGSFLASFSNVLAKRPFSITEREGYVDCLIEHFPFTAGQYVINLIVRNNNVIEDWVQEAAILNVENGDFFGTGRVVSSDHGGVLVPQQWNLPSCD